MYIEWVNHPYKPELNGTREHVARSFGEVACGYGQAKLAPRPNYGTPEWVKERQDAAAKAAPVSGDVNPTVTGVEWGIRDKAQSRFSKVIIVKRTGAETAFFEQPPADCPPSIRARFAELTGKDAALDPEVIQERVFQQKLKDETEQKKQRQAEAGGVLSILLGGRK